MKRTRSFNMDQSQIIKEYIQEIKVIKQVVFENRPLSTDDLEISRILVGDNDYIAIRPLTADDLIS